MPKTEREAQACAQEHDLYAAIGRFVVEFEHVCRAMEECIVGVPGKDGLETEGLARAPLVGLPAGRLFKSFKAVVTELHKNDPEDMRILENVSKRIGDLIEKRNDVIHRTWFIGWDHSKDSSKAEGEKFKRTKRGAESQRLEVTVDQFESLSWEAEELSDIVTLVGGCMVEGFPFSMWLMVGQDGTVGPRSIDQ
jgi:hypothetical protein